MDLNELKQRGLSALQQKLSYVRMVRSIQQFDVGSGDYTKDRHQWQDELTVAVVMALIKERRKQS